MKSEIEPDAGRPAEACCAARAARTSPAQGCASRPGKDHTLLAPDEDEACAWSPRGSAGCAEFGPSDCEQRCRKALPE